MRKHLLLCCAVLISVAHLWAQTILGIDVSHYNGTINWTQVSAAGKTFAWCKATEGISYTDPTYATYMTGGNAAGVVMGAYHFARPASNSATDEANHFLAVASNHIGAGYLPPVLDLEDPPTGSALSAVFTSAQLTTWVQTWLNVVQSQTGIAPVIYTSASYAGYLNSSLNTYKLWIANPGTSATTAPSNIGNWTTWAFKQYSWVGAVSGISGDVDLDVFHGTAADFNNLVGTNPCSAPSNDNCPGTPITSNGACLTGTVACSSGSYGANQCTGCTCTSSDDYDVYYSFTAQATSHTVTVSNYAANFDAVVELRTACALGSYVGCYDPVGAPGSLSYTWNNLTIGNTYYLRVFEYDYASSPPTTPTFDICVTHTVCTPPTALITPSGTTICSGTSTTLTASGGGAYSWSTGATTAAISVSPANTTTYTVTVGSSGCTATASATVTVNTTPTASISPSGVSICNGSSATLTANGGGTYAWSTGASSAAISVSPTSNATYTVTVSSNNCSATASRMVSVSAAPTASISPSGTTICSGASATLTASGGTNYNWSTGGTTAGINVSPTGTTTYTVTVTSPGCAVSPTASTTVNVNTTPGAGISPASVAVCSGASATLTASGGGSYVWSNGSTSTSIMVSPLGSTSYSVTVTSNGCTATASRTVTVNNVPSASINPASSSICAGSSATLTAGGAGSYTWSNSLGNNAQISVSPVNAAIYSVTVTDANTCTASASASVAVNSLPGVPTFSPVSGCSPVVVTANSTNCTGCAYAWSTGSNLSTSSFASSGAFSVTATSSNNCSASANGNVTVNGQPAATIIVSAPGICNGGSATLTANPAGAGYSWSGPGNFNSTASQVTASAAGTYTVTITDPGSCTGTISATATILQYSAPVADAGTDQTNTGTGVTIGGNPTAGGGQTPYTYAWSPASFLSSTFLANPMANPVYTTTYTVVVTDNNGCTAGDEVIVTVPVCPSYTISNSSVNEPETAGNDSVTLTAGAGCPWTLTGNCSWVTFNTTSGTGTSVISFSYQANSTTVARSCVVNIEGNIFTINQAAVAVCIPIPDFIASPSAGLVPFTANFTDQSTNSPTQWNWQFPGGNPPTSVLQNPTVVYNSDGVYDVYLKVSNNCGVDSIVKLQYINVLATGIEVVSAVRNISVFPNPNTGAFTVYIKGDEGKEVKLNLFNALGQLIESRNLLITSLQTQCNFDVRHHAKGVYYLQTYADGKYSYFKILVE